MIAMRPPVLVPPIMSKYYLHDHEKLTCLRQYLSTTAIPLRVNEEGKGERDRGKGPCLHWNASMLRSKGYWFWRQQGTSDWNSRSHVNIIDR
jgi:hypothetical protein